MKNKLLPFIVMFGKVSVYGLVVYAFIINALLASEGNAQRVLSVKEAKISLTAEGINLEKAFKLIEKNSDYVFVYNRENLDNEIKLSLQARENTVESLLMDISKQANVGFKQVNNRISVKSHQTDGIEVVIEQTPISGRVTDESGEGLPGATVLVKGTNVGTVTDFDGYYNLNISAGSDLLLTVSFVGYQSVEVPINGQTELNVTLKPDFTSLEEVVVVGYGSIQKKDLTGAVASVGNRELTKVGATSPMGALQTNIAGVDISPRTGTVGSGFTIQIRGANSLNGASPLFVVDGVMTDDINFLNPNDIERIDVLKDASSTAIYGSRGSNGVVIVTTKSGAGVKNKRTTVNYSGFVGLRKVSNMPDFLNSYDESVMWNKDRQMARDLVQGNTIVPSTLYGFPYITNEDGIGSYWGDALAKRRGTDWVDELIKPSIQQNHFVSAAGGGETSSYVVGFGYQGDDGNAKGQYYKKYNFKASIDARPNKMFSVGSNVNLAFSERELVSRQGYTRQIFRMPSYAPAKDADGNYIQSPMVGISGNVNPYAYLESNSQYNVEEYYIISNFYLKYKPVEWLSFQSTFSPNARFVRSGEYFDRFATRSISVARMWNDNFLSYIWDNQLNISKKFGEHSMGYDFIQSSQLNRTENAFAYGRDVPFESLWYNTQSAPQRDASTGFSKNTLLSFTNRLNYSFRDRYHFTATVRWDGSSKLAEDNKWAYFPSAAVAWRMSEEAFLSNTIVDNLKLRLSFGYTGNNNIPAYSTQSSLNRQAYYDWDGSTADGFVPSAISNKDLTWERTREWNLGTDFSLFRSRVSGEVNVYDRLSLDLLMERKLAMPTGWGTMIDNVGSVSNKGVEVQLRTVNIDRDDFSWETNFIFTKNINKIVDLYGAKEDDVPNRWFIGEPVDVIYSMVYDGVWQASDTYESEADKQALEGTAKVKDLNGDGAIDIDNDMKVLGSPAPNWIGTFSTTFRYKNWDLSATIYTKQGMLVYSPFHREFTDFNSKVILDVPYYKRDNPISGPRYTNEYPQPSYMGQYYGEDAEDYGYPGYNKDVSFTRIQNITLGYNLPRDLLGKVGISEVRVYFNAFNPFVFTKYEGFDPEWAGASMSGVDATNTSFSIYQLGTNIKF
ncbi:TonB-dependent receptor [Marinoscillum sp. MHG1-6]|uniref:SusC/RagA family TonB-linked outer membrane protein n=1 Tax=Marinoscillum sp. MHG1-6 TaxID=2959627 RepID=UPI00215779CF|nr:TonB-dependent receptor [Marinoscillum sp. MHG1-6]